MPRRDLADFPRSARLLRKREFDRAMRRGRKVVVQGAMAWSVRPDGDAPPAPRLGLSVSKRVGGAPRRNRVKRVLREAFRLMRTELPPKDLVLVVRPEKPPLTLAAAQDTLRAVLQRLASPPRRRRARRPGDKRPNAPS